MSTYLEYMEEKQTIDHYVKEGFKVVYVEEHIEGDTITWAKSEENEKLTQQLKTADARKYLGDVLIQQLS